MATLHVSGAAALQVAESSNARVASVRAWFTRPAARPMSSPYGFSGKPDAFDEGVLYVGTA